MEPKDFSLLEQAYKNVYAKQQLDEFLGSGAQKAVDSVTKKIQGGLEKAGVKINRTQRGTVTRDQQQKRIQQNNSVDVFELVKGHLMSEGFADDEKAALAIMANMSEEWRNEIVEQYRAGFRPDGRYQNADGSHTGPVMGALKSIFSGNLPKSRTVIPPTPQPSVTVTQTRTPVKPTPYSKGEDGKLTDFGAGGGDAKMRRTGMSVAEVEALGRKNKAAKGPKPYEQGGPRLPGRDM